MVGSILIFVLIQNFDINQASQAWKAANLYWLLPALIIVESNNWTQAMRWRAVWQNSKPPLADFVHYLRLGNIIAPLLPSGLNEIVRSIGLGKEQNDLKTAVISSLYAKVLGLLILMCLPFCFTPWLGTSFAHLLPWSLLSFAMGSLGLSLLASSTHWLSQQRATEFEGWKQKILLLLGYGDSKTFVVGSAYTVVIQFQAILIQAFIFKALNVSFDWSTIAWATLVITLSTVLPISFMGIGVREGTAIYLYCTLLSYSKESILLIAACGYLLLFTQIVLNSAFVIKRNLHGKL